MQNKPGRAGPSGSFPIGFIVIGILMVACIWYVAYSRGAAAEERRKIEAYQAEERRHKARAGIDAEDAAQQRALEKVPCTTCAGRGLIQDANGQRTCQDCNATGKMLKK